MQDDKNTSQDKTLRCGSRTYFFDVREAKNGSKFLIIAESRFTKNEKNEEERRRNSFILFKEDLKGFATILDELRDQL